ncbi:hypothetical protein CEP51_014891 [Fusarium floridanum]|uniref:Uncharacterized protein n=1 Tax=Fusarium floridanum TaxID=1325733 RepID=A0A428PK74_9HYPO|nr:hypothetical protein CEP51_014891 [Fusarium floridanum]
MTDQGGRGPNPRRNKKRPGPPSLCGTDLKRRRTAPYPSTPEGTHAPGMATENPLDQPSSSTHSNRNPEPIRPHPPPHRRDGEDTSAALVPQHMLPQRFDFFLAPGVRESIATQNEERLSTMIERIQRGQVDGFVFDREQLAWTWEGMQDDFFREANDGRIGALNQNARMITDNPDDSDNWSPEGSPDPEEKVLASDAVPWGIINAMYEAVVECPVLAADWDDVLDTLEGLPTYRELWVVLELVSSNLTRPLDAHFERMVEVDWGYDAQCLTAMREFPLHVVRAGGAMTYEQEGKVDVLQAWSSFRDHLHADIETVWLMINEARDILADVNIDNFRLIYRIMRAFYISPACRDQVNLRDRLVDLLDG